MSQEKEKKVEVQKPPIPTTPQRQEDQADKLLAGSGADAEQQNPADVLEEPATKSITFRKVASGWQTVFTGPVSRKDINRLREKMRLEWTRMKRRERIENRKTRRQAEEKELSSVE